MVKVPIACVLILSFILNVAAENQASIKTTKIEKDVAIVAWVDGDAIDLASLEPKISRILKAKLNRKNPCQCIDAVNSLAAGNRNYLENAADRQFANSFLLKYSANKRPADRIETDKFRDQGDYRLFSHLVVSFEVRNGSLVGPLNYSHYETLVGETPDPCGLPAWKEILGQVWLYVKERKDVVSPDKSMWDGIRGDANHRLIYQINQGRIGILGQRVHKTLNWCKGKVPCSIKDANKYTPWIWSVIKISASGNLELDRQVFPRYFIYEKGERQALLVNNDADLEAFLIRDDRSEIRPKDIREPTQTGSPSDRIVQTKSDVIFNEFLGDPDHEEKTNNLKRLFKLTDETQEKLQIASLLLNSKSLEGKDRTEIYSYLAYEARLAIMDFQPFPFKITQEHTYRGFNPAFVQWCQSKKISLDDSGQLRRAIIEAIHEKPIKVLYLAMSGEPRSVDMLRTALDSPNYLIAANAAKGLAKLQDTYSIERIIQACKEKPHHAAQLIAEALIFFKEPQVKEKAKEYIKDDEFFEALRLRAEREGSKGIFGF